MEFIVVTGAPCAGKSTYIDGHKGANDAVFKFDGFNGEPSEIRSQRKQFIDANKSKPSGRCYIEACKVTEQLEDDLKGTDWHLHAITSGYDQCLRNLKASGRTDKPRWKTIIENYFGESSPEGLFSCPDTGNTSLACTGRNQHPAQGRKEAMMAEDTTTNQTDAAQQPAGAQDTVDNTDWKAEARKWEQRAKENKAAADRLAELEKQDEAAKSDLEKANAKADRALKELEALKTAQKRADMVKAAAKSHDVDEELLSMMTGDTEDEIEANAKALKEKFAKVAKYPDVNDKGATSNKTGMTKKEILEIKNPREQLRAAMENPHAFD